MSDQRRHRLRLEISREAARLFWEHGVAATSGDRIAGAVGLSTRTLWRHFRSKESCAEPIVSCGVAWELAALRDWPRRLSLEAHLAAEIAGDGHEADAAARGDAVLARRMILLSGTEPSLRTAWLTACSQLEREMTGVVARRLGRPAGDVAVRLHAAAASAALRVVNEDLGAAALSGAGPYEVAEVSRRLARAVRSATGGAIGDAVGGSGRHNDG